MKRNHRTDPTRAVLTIDCHFDYTTEERPDEDVQYQICLPDKILNAITVSRLRTKIHSTLKLAPDDVLVSGE